MKRIYNIIFSVLFILGCGYAPTEETYNPDYTPEIAVFSIISTDDNQEFVIVEKTFQLNENDKGNSKIIDDAEVFIISEDDTVQFFFYQTYNNEDDYFSKGIYLDLYNEFLAEAGKTYRLVVNVPDGTTVTGSTTVPETPTILQPTPGSILQKETIANTSIEFIDDPNTIGYSVNFIVEISGTNKKINILPEYYTNESPITLSFIDDFLLFNNVIPLRGIATIKIIALDQNSYDYLLKSDLASYIGTDLNILEGGVGAFGSFSVASVMVRWQ